MHLTEKQIIRSILYHKYQIATRRVLKFEKFGIFSKKEFREVLLLASALCGIDPPIITYTSTTIFVCRIEGRQIEFILNEGMLNESYNDCPLDIVAGAIKTIRRVSMSQKLPSRLMRIDEESYFVIFFEFFLQMLDIYTYYDSDLKLIFEIENRVDDIMEGFITSIISTLNIK